jgi:hypothetical protein
METVVDQIRKLKTQAKNRRDLRRYDAAVRILQDAIGVAERSLSNSELRTQMAEELADCNGLLGGVQRRWALESDGDARDARLRDSIRAYDAAWKFESGDYGVVNSYGMVNRLVSRLLLLPKSLFTEDVTDFGPGIEQLAMRVHLKDALDRIEAQLSRPRRDDYWAAADLALVNALLENEDGRSAYVVFLRKVPPAYAFKSVLDVLRPLAALPWPLRESLTQAVEFLEERSPEQPA